MRATYRQMGHSNVGPPYTLAVTTPAGKSVSKLKNNNMKLFPSSASRYRECWD